MPKKFQSDGERRHCTLKSVTTGFMDRESSVSLAWLALCKYLQNFCKITDVRAPQLSLFKQRIYHDTEQTDR